MSRTKAPRIFVPKDGDISKKSRKSSAVVFWGGEPEWEPFHPLDTIAEKQEHADTWMGHALSWYNAMTDEKNKKNYLVAYAQKYMPEFVDSIESVPVNEFVSGPGHTYAAVGRSVLRGAILRSKYVTRVHDYIRQLASKYGKKLKMDEPKIEYVVKVRDPKVTECISTVDGMLDEFGFGHPRLKFPTASMADAVLKAGATPSQKTKVYEKFSSMVIELQQVLNGSDVELKEAYGAESKANIQKVFNWLTGPVSEGIVQNTRPRKARKKKEKTPAQLLKKFSYQKSDPELNVFSIDPENILGAQQLWIFNTKTRKLGVYYAKDDGGLKVYRKSIDNYDETKSVCKKVRKPKEIVPQVASLGKVAMRHFLDEIRATESPLNSRISETVLLLRAVK
jgi:hypothetical protein